MPSSTLIVYEPLDSFREKSQYWSRYLKFYELYWGGPTSPFGIWFGNEYSAFRQALSDHLDSPHEDLPDCLFMKDEGGSYFVAPTSDSLNCFSSENIVPFEWFLLFSEEGRKNFYTHWGFNSIHYNSTLEHSKSRLVSSRDKIEKTMSSEPLNSLEFFLHNLDRSLEDLRKWLVQFDSRSYMVLNYGDICNYIHPYTLKNENSVTEVNKILELVSLSNFAEAELALKVFFQKWDDISTKCAGGTGESRIQ
ncbi:MAG: hypothetical protein OXF23_01475 [Candidatus Dadabacteria bacterium]|nr:hypothetical protein [Candidatus Dadabacteria bacterium]MCY4262738.1 hypothetical protein [Candidatus Dadabacteria bacterium]